MKVLLINSVLGIGSTGRIVESLYNFFKDEGNDVKVAYGRNKATCIPKEDQYCFYNKLNVYSHALMSRITDKTGFYSKVSTKKLIKFIENFKPDVVNIHNLHGYYINIELLLTYLAEKNIKTVFTLHDCWLFTGHCSHFYYNNCGQYQKSCENCKFKNVYPKSNIFSNSMKNFIKKKELVENLKNKSFIVPSKWLKNFMLKSYLKDENIEVVYNAINYDIFNVEAKKYFDESKLPFNNYILCVSNYWNEQKGLNKVVELSKILDDELKIVLIGNLKDKSILNDKIIHISHTNNVRELAFYYANAKIFFNPTLEDNFPTVNIESLACGTPIILYKDCSGGEEIITQNNGFVVEQNINERELVNIIKSSNFDRHIISQEIQQKLSKEKFFKDYKRILDVK